MKIERLDNKELKITIEWLVDIEGLENVGTSLETLREIGDANVVAVTLIDKGGTHARH